jgi:excisionase family DNA binding protein
VTPSPIDLQTAADRLGVHYQTAYKWVRSGRLPAQRIRGRYELDPDDVERLARQRTRPASRRTLKPRAGFAKVAARAYDALVDGDERSVRDLVDRLSSEGTSMTTVTQEILAPAMRRIGADWHDGVVAISDEHRASAIVERVVGDHYPNPRGRRRGTVVVAALSGERHALPTSMAALALREDNWHVQHLGADLPAEELLKFCRERRIDLVVLTATTDLTRAAAHECVDALGELGVRALVGEPGDTLTDLQRRARTKPGGVGA